MSQSLYQSHNATTILYTPLTYAYNNSSTSWLATPNGHTSLFPNASFHIEWSGKGIHVNGTAGQGTLLASLDGAPFSDISVNQGSGLIDYPSLGYGNHSLTVMNKPGGNMTVTSLALLGVEKFHEAKTKTTRTIPATVKNSTGALIMNPQFMWDGDWVIDASTQVVSTKPRVLTSFAFNISDTSQVEVYGVGSSFTISANGVKKNPESHAGLSILHRHSLPPLR